MQIWQLALIATGVAVLVGAGTFTAMYYMEKPSTLQAYDPEIIKAYKDFIVKFNKKQGDPDFAAYRLGVFAGNYKMIQAHNAKQSTYTLGVNQFADLTHAEFVKTYLGLLPVKSTMSKRKMHVNTGVTTGSIDWVSKGAVTAIKDQGQCGSCWAFSTTGSVESATFLSGSALPDLSEQQLVDCSDSFGNQGCNGGLMDQAFQYIMANGITSEDQYPYTAVDGTCTYTSSMSVATVKSFADVQAGSAKDLANALQQQPISIAVDAETWQFYSGGVFSDCGTSLDHGVLLVGQSSSSWTVKNSWGTSWGEAGYIQLAPGNTCGMANAASYPTA